MSEKVNPCLLLNWSLSRWEAYGRKDVHRDGGVFTVTLEMNHQGHFRVRVQDNILYFGTDVNVATSAYNNADVSPVR